MKNLLKTLVFLAITNSSKAQVSNFTITNNSGNYSLTCSQTSVFLMANTNVIGPVTFHWAGPSFSVTGATATLTQPGAYTVTAHDSLNSVFGTQYLTIGINTVVPASGVSPVTQSINCNTPIGAAVTSSASGNMSHSFISPYGTTVTSSQAVASYTSLGAGTYTHILVNNITGCSSSSTFTLTSNQGFPTFSVSSANNFSLGCNSLSVGVVSINNAATAPVSGGPISYTFMSLSQSNPVPSGVLSGVSVYTVSTPGLYYVIVRDNTSSCSTQIPVSIVSNTLTPNITATVPNQILNCATSQVVLQGNSTTANVNFGWNFVGTPGSVIGTTVLATSNSVIPTATLINTYTFVVTDLSSTCKSFSVIPMYQNLFPPVALISNGGNATLTCATPTIVLINQSSTGIPASTGFSTSLPVIGYAWYAPAQSSLALSTTYTANASGTYTMIAKDQNNGCTSIATKILYGGCNTVGIQKNQGQAISVSVFPNPGNGVFTITSEEFQKNTTLEVYNSIGMLVKKQPINSNKAILDIPEQANGIYTLRFLQDNKVLHISKLVKE